MKSFAGQPEGGGVINVLTAQDLDSTVNKFDISKVFKHAPLFVDNCEYCSNPNTMNLDGIKINADAAQKSPFDLLDTIKWGANVWSADQQRKSAQEQAALALQIEQTKLAADKAKAAAAQSKSTTVVSTIKAYSTPLIITGVFAIGGIAAYFYFKKKKIA